MMTDDIFVVSFVVRHSNFRFSLFQIALVCRGSTRAGNHCEWPPSSVAAPQQAAWTSSTRWSTVTMTCCWWRPSRNSTRPASPPAVTASPSPICSRPTCALPLTAWPPRWPAVRPSLPPTGWWRPPRTTDSVPVDRSAVSTRRASPSRQIRGRGPTNGSVRPVRGRLVLVRRPSPPHRDPPRNPIRSSVTDTRPQCRPVATTPTVPTEKSVSQKNVVLTIQPVERQRT